MPTESVGQGPARLPSGNPVALTEPYRSFVDQSVDAIVLGQSGRVVAINPAACRLFAISQPTDLLEQNLVHLFAPETLHTVSAHLAESAASRPTAPAEARIVRPDGSWRDVEISSAWLPTEATLHLSLRDVTDRKAQEARLHESEERLTLAFAGAQEGVWDWNLETNAVVYSD